MMGDSGASQNAQEIPEHPGKHAYALGQNTKEKGKVPLFWVRANRANSAAMREAPYTAVSRRGVERVGTYLIKGIIIPPTT